MKNEPEHKTQKQIDSLFQRRMDAYNRANRNEIASFASIPLGYGMRAYHHFKTASNRSGNIRYDLEQMLRDYSISHNLLKEAIRQNILSSYEINKYQHTNF